MSTHSTVSMQTNDGKFKTIYCHFDGYIGGVGKELFKTFNTYEKAEALIKPR